MADQANNPDEQNRLISQRMQQQTGSQEQIIQDKYNSFVKVTNFLIFVLILYMLFFWYLFCAFEQICYPDGYLLSSTTQVSILFMFIITLSIISFYLVITYYYTFQLTPLLTIFTLIIIVYNIIYSLIILLADMTLNQSVVNTNWNQFGPVYKAYFNQDKNKFKTKYESNMMIAGIFHLVLAVIQLILIINLLIYYTNFKSIQQQSQSNQLGGQQFIPKIISHERARFPKKKLLMRDKDNDLNKFMSENLQMFNDMRKENRRKKQDNEINEFQEEYNDRNMVNQPQGFQQNYI